MLEKITNTVSTLDLPFGEEATPQVLFSLIDNEFRKSRQKTLDYRQDRKEKLNYTNLTYLSQLSWKVAEQSTPAIRPLYIGTRFLPLISERHSHIEHEVTSKEVRVFLANWARDKQLTQRNAEGREHEKILSIAYPGKRGREVASSSNAELGNTNLYDNYFMEDNASREKLLLAQNISLAYTLRTLLRRMPKKNKYRQKISAPTQQVNFYAIDDQNALVVQDAIKDSLNLIFVKLI
jgi:hypothetical protein